MENCCPAHPFVKWAGGKTQLIEEIRKVLPLDLEKRKHLTYIEPFVGGGAVFFWILQEYPNIERAIINDINQELVDTYHVIKNDVENLILSLQELQQEYISLALPERTAYFLEKRQIFNKKNIHNTNLAALFIFLNRTCFNGLYRVNAKGEFNVPHGKYRNPKIADENNLRACSQLLQKVEILDGDFEQTESYVVSPTFVYCDPPYRPLDATSSFNSYAKETFDDVEQIRLKKFVDRLSSRNCAVMLSNSDCKGRNPNDTFFDDLYRNYIIERVYASRFVNANPAKRGKLTELLIRNYAKAMPANNRQNNFNFNINRIHEQSTYAGTV